MNIISNKQAGCFFVFFNWYGRWLMLLGALCLAAATAQAAPFAYLANRKLNTVSVVDLANHATLARISLGAKPALPIDVVANDASGKVFVAQATGVAIIDAASQAVTGTVAVGPVKAMVVSPNGKKVFALTDGVLAIIDAGSQAVLATLKVDPSAVSLAIDKDGETVYVAHTGLAAGTNDALGVAGITIIDGLTNQVASVVKTADFRPDRMAVNPADDKLYLISNSGAAPEKQVYRVFNPATQALARVAFTLPADTPVVFGLSTLAFNQDGSRLILGGYSFGFTAIPLIEIATATGTVSRVLSVPAGLADQHTVIKLASNFAGGRFWLGVFLSEHLHHYPVEPGRRAVFLDGASGTVLGDMDFPGPGDGDLLVGDILSALPGAGAGASPGDKLQSRTVLQTGAAPRRDTGLSLFATVSGNNPTGQVEFRFFPSRDPEQVQKIVVPVSGGMASLALPACSILWDQIPLQQLVCGVPFGVLARFKGDAVNGKSKSDVLYPSLAY